MEERTMDAGGYYDPEEDLYIRQVVENANYDLSKVADADVSQIANGWIFKKRFKVKSGKDLQMGVNENEWLIGNIYDYYINRYYDEKGNCLYYVNFYCGLLIPNMGFYAFTIKTTANFTVNSDLTNILVKLGIDVCRIQDLYLDDLRGMPIKARLTKDHYGIRIFDIARRVI